MEKIKLALRMLTRGQLAVEGKIDSVVYSAQRGRRRSLFSRGEK